MNQARSLRWFFVGVCLGLVVIGVGALVRSLEGISPPANQAEAGEVDVPEKVGAGLRIECRNDDECIQTSENDWKDGRGPLRRRFLRMRVYNDGPRTVEGCCVALRHITEITPDGLVSTNYQGPVLLIWAGDQSTRREGKVIRRNANPEVADLLYTVHTANRDQITLKDEAYSSFLKFGKSYDFEVVVSAPGVEPVSKDIKVRFGPTWDDFEVVSD